MATMFPPLASAIIYGKRFVFTDESGNRKMYEADHGDENVVMMKCGAYNPHIVMVNVRDNNDKIAIHPDVMYSIMSSIGDSPLFEESHNVKRT